MDRKLRSLSAVVVLLCAGLVLALVALSPSQPAGAAGVLIGVALTDTLFWLLKPHFGTMLAVTDTAIISAGNYTDPDNNSATAGLSVPNLAPKFASTPVLTATEGLLYTLVVTATGDTLGITAPMLPAWLELVDHGGTATLSDTPAAADLGENEMVLCATDSGGLYVEQPFAITVGEELPFKVYVPLVLLA